MKHLFCLCLAFIFLVLIGCNSVEPGEIADFKVYWSESCYQGSEYIGIFFEGGMPGARYKVGQAFGLHDATGGEEVLIVWGRQEPDRTIRPTDSTLVRLDRKSITIECD